MHSHVHVNMTRFWKEKSSADIHNEELGDVEMIPLAAERDNGILSGIKAGQNIIQNH